MTSLTLDDFLTSSAVAEFTWLPDGSGLIYAAVSLDTGTQEIFRFDLANAHTSRLTGTHAPPLRTSPLADRPEPKTRPVVSADGRRVFFTSSRYFQSIDNIFSVGVDGRDLVQHTFHDAVIETGPAPSPDGRTLVYFNRTPRGTKALSLDLDNPRAWPIQVSPGEGQERDLSWSPDGAYLAFTRGGDIWIHATATGEERRLVAPGLPAVANASWSPDSTRIAVTSTASGFAQIGIVSVDSGALTPLTYAPRQHESPAWAPDGRSVCFVMSEGLGLSNQIAVAAADGTGEIRELTTGVAVRRSPQFAPDGGAVAYLETASNRPSDIWSVPVGGGAPRRLTESLGRLRPEELSVAEEVSYPTIDNLPIRTLVLKPANFDPSRRYPAVVALHGHPSQWNHSMNLLWQYVISRGVVIVAPNPRGTVGLGQGFHDLHVGDYCGAEFEDIMACVEYVKTLPYIDPQRIASWGGSGGGNMSLLIATKAPDAFVAQVIRAPVSSWKWLAIDRYTGQSRHATPFRDPQLAREEMGGSYEQLAERYDERSPLNFVEHARIPQLLMHGLRDSSVPHNESRRWVRRMRELGKGHLVDYVEYPDEDHSLLRYRETVRDQLGRIVAFLAHHLNAPELLDDPTL